MAFRNKEGHFPAWFSILFIAGAVFTVPTIIALYQDEHTPPSKTVQPVHTVIRNQFYVTPEKLNVRLAPSINGKITNVLSKRQVVTVFETKDGWARISRYYDGESEGLQGNVARWVSSKYLSTNYPQKKKPATNTTNSPIIKAIQSSDDFEHHHKAFVTATEKLIREGRCKLGDFKEMGGWWSSPSYKPAPIYFTYCGAMSVSNRIYLDASNGRIFQ